MRIACAPRLPTAAGPGAAVGRNRSPAAASAGHRAGISGVGAAVEDVVAGPDGIAHRLDGFLPLAAMVLATDPGQAVVAFLLFGLGDGGVGRRGGCVLPGGRGGRLLDLVAQDPVDRPGHPTSQSGDLEDRCRLGGQPDDRHDQAHGGGEFTPLLTGAGPLERGDRGVGPPAGTRRYR